MVQKGKTTTTIDRVLDEVAQLLVFWGLQSRVKRQHGLKVRAALSAAAMRLLWSPAISCGREQIFNIHIFRETF